MAQCCCGVCSGLPSKSPDDILRHQMMYDQMVEAARKKGQWISHAQSTPCVVGGVAQW